MAWRQGSSLGWTALAVAVALLAFLPAVHWLPASGHHCDGEGHDHHGAPIDDCPICLQAATPVLVQSASPGLDLLAGLPFPGRAWTAVHPPRAGARCLPAVRGPPGLI